VVWADKIVLTSAALKRMEEVFRVMRDRDIRFVIEKPMLTQRSDLKEARTLCLRVDRKGQQARDQGSGENCST